LWAEKDTSRRKFDPRDITPRLLYGADEDGEGLNITWGYNKEHRKDLKTVLYDLLLSGVDGKK
jgi:transposase